MSQEKSSQIVKKNYSPAFGLRLREAFDGLAQAEIARRLGITDAGVKNYFEGRIPSGITLLEICDLTGVSIHWLLTGEGPKEREIVKAIKNGQVDYNEIRRKALIDHHLSQVRSLVNEENQATPTAQLKKVGAES